jgi:hypothetical protein
VRSRRSSRIGGMEQTAPFRVGRTAPNEASPPFQREPFWPERKHNARPCVELRRGLGSLTHRFALHRSTDDFFAPGQRGRSQAPRLTIRLSVVLVGAVGPGQSHHKKASDLLIANEFVRFW